MASFSKRFAVVSSFVLFVFGSQTFGNGLRALDGTQAMTVPASSSVLATVMTTLNQSLELLVLWRGSPGWWSRPSGHLEQSYSGGESGVFTVALQYGSIALDLSYESTAHTVHLKGKSISVPRDTNVLLIDDVDSGTGPRLVKALFLDQGDANLDPRFRSMGPLFHRSNEIVSFLRCDVGEMTVMISRLACGDIGK
jgi:hypothetical protein